MTNLPEQKIANEMIRDGATPGMVRKFLRDQGVREEQLDQVIRSAQRIDTGRNRAGGSLSLLAGIVLLTGAAVVLFMRMNNPAAGGGSLPIVLFVGGMILVGKGFITMVSGIRGV